MKTIKVAVVQASPALFNKKETLKIIDGYMKEAQKKKASLVVFPEATIPAYPWGLSFGTLIGKRSTEGRELWRSYWENSIEVPSKDTEQLGKMGKRAKTYLVIGVIEKDINTQGTLYCTLLYFAPDGSLMGKHRKIKPTAAERYIWGEGDGTDLTVYETPLGRIGGLICWENYMPLARMSMYQQGVQIYLAPTADQRDSWLATMQHIACEGRCYVLGCNQYVTKKMYPAKIRGFTELKKWPEKLCRGASVIVDPLGNIVEGPLLDKDGILYADLDLNKAIEAKMDLDVAGHYNRPDIFEFKVKK